MTTSVNVSPKVEARALSVTVDYPAHFVALERTVGTQLLLPHPFASDDSDTWRAINKHPGVFPHQGIELRLHGGHPVGVLQRGLS